MDVQNQPDLALPKGSLILVTGATGYIAANIVREALDLGYRVRGTARSEEKVENTKSLFRSDKYEGVVVAEMEHEGGFDEAVKGVDGIIHAASPVTWSPNPKLVVRPAVNGAISIMKAALNEPSVKRFVFTSSSVAATLPTPNKKFKLEKTTWNNDVADYVDFPPPYDESKGGLVYAASKVEAERAVWKFVKDNKPQFVVNTILPNYNMGRIVGTPGTTANMIISAYKGDPFRGLTPQYMIDVIDDARIHIAAAIDKTVSDERIYAFNTPFNWNDAYDAFRQLRPDKTFPDNEENPDRDLSEVDNAFGQALLKKWWGQTGYTSLKDSLAQNIEGLD